MRLPPDVLDLVLSQHGVVARRQLLRLLGAEAVDGYTRRGFLVRVERGVYRSRLTPVTPQARAMAAVLRSGAGARLTGPFVLALAGVAGLDLTASWEVLLPPGRTLTGVAFRHRADPTPTDDGDRLHNLPTVRPVSALIDSVRCPDLDRRALRLAYDSCRWKGLVREPEVVDRAGRLGPRDPGAATFLAWHRRGELRPESEGERRLGMVVSRIGPPPEPQVEITGYRLDWYWVRYRFGLEYQGVTDHTSAQDRLADTARLHVLHRHGVEIHTVTAEDLRDPPALLRRIHRLLVARAQELGVAEPVLV